MGVSRRLVEREHFGIAGTLPASFSKNTPFASPPHQSKVLGRVGYGGGRTLLQKGFPPPLFPKEKLMFDCIVVGAGHAGCEAAMTLARFGQRVLLITGNVEQKNASHSRIVEIYCCIYGWNSL